MIDFKYIDFHKNICMFDAPDAGKLRIARTEMFCQFPGDDSDSQSACSVDNGLGILQELQVKIQRK